jgi:serine/threonine-protein kinase
MGAVYAVVHQAIGKRAALKVVHQRLLVPGFNCDRMVLEAQVVNQVGHPNIVDIFETGKLDDGRPYIVMERLEGQPLSVRAENGKLRPDLVIAILLQICDALIAAHAAGVVHRDLKLDNVFLVDNPEDPATPKVKLLDWGIAKVLSHDVKHTIEGQLIGTPQYLAPEQARGQAVSAQTDVYSLGVMAFELFLEQLPFEAETAAEVMAMHLRLQPPRPSDLWPNVPPELEYLLLAMLAKQPDQRPTTLEVARRLEAVRAEFVRRRQPPSASCVAVTTPRPSTPGASLSVVLATAPDCQPGTRPWQYAVGVFALVAAALLFWISRAGDHAAIAGASAATAEVAPAAPPAGDLTQPAPLAGDPIPVQLAIESEATVPIAIPAPPPQMELVSVMPPAVALPTARPAKHRPARASAPHPAPERKPAVPRRGTKVDPDGTLEPYI